MNFTRRSLWRLICSCPGRHSPATESQSQSWTLQDAYGSRHLRVSGESKHRSAAFRLKTSRNCSLSAVRVGLRLCRTKNNVRTDMAGELAVLSATNLYPAPVLRDSFRSSQLCILGSA